MKLLGIHIVLICLLTLLVYHGNSQVVSGKGQAVGWITLNLEDPFMTQVGLRYLPSLMIDKAFEKGWSLDGEFTLNTYGTTLLSSGNSPDWEGDIKPYRGWVRISGDQFEVRAGLQKLNFGSASILRPLMWFDKIDPRDPLQMTEGVDGLLLRYYFLNNANIWLWGLVGNDDLRGWDTFKTNKKKPEAGGRVQVPFFIGELAATYHYREGTLKGVIPDTLQYRDWFSENKYALDGKFDWEIGFWFEGAVIHQNLNFTNLQYQQMLNVGIDYTFGIGSGLNVIAEYFTYQVADKPFSTGDGIDLVALSANYPISIISNVNAIVYYDITNRDWYRFINYSMVYDKWSFYYMAYWNPDRFQIYNIDQSTNLYSGWGFQLMAVFNH